ncbi:hypothetical protein JCM8202v2_001580 [Rhodotorula sphaerocarpa]
MAVQADSGGARIATRRSAAAAAAITSKAAPSNTAADGPAAHVTPSPAPRTRSRAGSVTKQPIVKTRALASRVTATPPPPHPQSSAVAAGSATAATPAPSRSDAGSASGSPGRTRSRAAAAAAAVTAAPASATPADVNATSAAGPEKEKHNTRFAQQRRPPAAVPPNDTPTAARRSPETARPAAYPVPANAPPGYRPASAKPPVTRVPTFPLVEAYVPDADPNNRRHPRQLLPEDLGFPTPEMKGRIQPDDLDDKLLMATCAVLHGFENRALCPKEVAEVMLERDWLKNAGTTPFAHVSTCIRSHVARAAAASPPYPPLLVPFELVGALTAEEVRAVGLHAEQRPAVKRGTLWYLNPRVLGHGVGADDPFVRCRREAGLAPSDRDGLYVRGLVPLQHAPPQLPPALSLSSTLFTNTVDSPVGSTDEGDFDEEGMGRGKRKRRASSAMMAAMGREGAKGAAPSPLGSGSSTPVPIPSVAAGAAVDNHAASPIPTISHRRTQSLGGPSSAPSRSGIPKLKFRLSSLEEVDDSDGHTGEAAEWRRKNKKKVRRAGSEGNSRSGSAEPRMLADISDESAAGAYSSASSSALLAQSLLAASSIDTTANDLASTAPQTTVSPDILSLGHASPTSFPFSRPDSGPVNLCVSAPNIFSHHFTTAPSPPDVVMDDSSSGEASRPSTSGGPTDSARRDADTAASPDSDTPDENEDDFHEAMLRGDDFDFEWGSESYSTTGTSSLEASTLAADLLAKAFEAGPHEVEGTPRGKSHELSAEQAGEEDEAAVDTPATTPRSLPQELEDDEKKENPSASAPEKKPSLEALREPISRVGMSITLCGEMVSAEEDRDVVVKTEEQAADDDANALANDDRSFDETRSDSSGGTRRRVDPLQIPAPPPSPLSLDLTPTLALSNAFAATDYDFVGRDEAESADEDLGSPSFIYGQDADVLADDEFGDNDDEFDGGDILHVKVEDDEVDMGETSTPSSRAGSALPPSFDVRLLSSVRAASIASTSDESDSLDPMSFVSPSTLATGLPVPQAAPSPPETNDWTISLDMLDDLDLDASGADLMGPETIGLEELDLAWAGDEGASPPAVPGEQDRGRPAAGLTLKVPRTGSSTFLTGSTHRFTSPMPSPRRALSSRSSSFQKEAIAPSASVHTLASAAVDGKAFGGSDSSSPSAVELEPVIPLDLPVLANIVQRGVVVFSVRVKDLVTGKEVPLLRRLDTDYVNATVLLQAALSSPLERASALATLLVKTDTFRVPAGDAEAGIEGTWIPLAAAEDFVATHSEQLGRLETFFGADLAANFPEPVPSMRSSAKLNIAQKRTDPNTTVLGSPPFEGAELLRRCGPPSIPRDLVSFIHEDLVDESTADALGVAEPAKAEADEEESVDDASAESPPPARTRRDTRTRRSASTTRTKAVEAAKVVEQSPPRRSSRRSAVPAK